MICPDAVADDGYAEICVVSNVECWGLLRAFSQIFTEAHVHHPACPFLCGRQIRVEAQRPLSWKTSRCSNPPMKGDVIHKKKTDLFSRRGRKTSHFTYLIEVRHVGKSRLDAARTAFL